MKTLDDLFVYEKSTAHHIKRWFDETCRLDAGGDVVASELWASWVQWADRNGVYRANPRRLGIVLTFLGAERVRLRSGTVRAWRGIAWKGAGL